MKKHLSMRRRPMVELGRNIEGRAITVAAAFASYSHHFLMIAVDRHGASDGTLLLK